MAHLEAGQKLGSENVTASTMTLVPGCGNRMIVPSEKKERKDYPAHSSQIDMKGTNFTLNRCILQAIEDSSDMPKFPILQVF